MQSLLTSVRSAAAAANAKSAGTRILLRHCLQKSHKKPSLHFFLNKSMSSEAKILPAEKFVTWNRYDPVRQ